MSVATGMLHHEVTGGYGVLANLISPITPELFFEKYYETSDLVINRSNPSHHQSILTLDDIDYAVSELHLNSSQIQMVNADAAEPLTASDYIDPSGFADPRAVFKLFDSGATIILPQLNRLLPKLNRFCAAIEDVFTCPFQTNVYMTPPGAQGFKIHWDTHDVFVAQAAGSKDWAVYDSTIELPLRSQWFDSARDDFGQPRSNFTLESGDTLYIPRGVPHCARSTSDISLHITVGILSYTWTELIVDAVSEICLRDSRLRRSLPPGFARAGFDSEVARKQFHDLLSLVAAEADFEKTFSALVDEFVGSRRQLFRGQLDAIRHANSVGLDQTMRPRDFLAYSLDLDDDGSTVVLKTYGLEMRIPATAEPALRHALCAASFTPRELPGSLDDEERLTLARRLVREGLVLPH